MHSRPATNARGSVQANPKTDGTASSRHKRDEPSAELTPLEKLLQTVGPVRQDGSDKFFGLENVRLRRLAAAPRRANC